MKRTMMMLLVVVALAVCVPAFAQQFPDVPTDHWAYQAVQDLSNAGIIQGYPDGTFGGKRALTRYEFAQALAKAIPTIAQMAGGAGAAGAPGQVGPQGPKGEPGITPEELTNIRNLINEFRDELAAQGVDIDALKKDVAALNDRVTLLENEVGRVKINAEVPIYVRGLINNSGAGFDRDSRSLGTKSNPLENVTFFNDIELGIKGKVSNSASVNSVFAAGNYLDFALGRNGAPAGMNEFSLWNLYLDAGMSLGPLGAAQVTVGRFPFQLTPLTLKFVDPDSYTYVSKLDDGNYVLDGGSVAFNVGKAALTAFAAKDNVITSTNNLMSPNLLATNAVVGEPISQLAGARAIIGTPFSGNLGLTYLQLGARQGRGQAQVFGADINATVSGIGVTAEYGQSKPNDTMVAAGIPDANNTAWNAKLNYQFGNFNVAGGYGLVESNYFAPGYWNRAGRSVNLQNVKGPMGSLTYAITPKISITADGQILDPDKVGTPVTARTSIQQGKAVSVASAAIDQITQWKAGIKYSLTSANTVDLGWEVVNWAAVAGAGNDAKERYISIGVGHSFNANANLKLLYQIDEYWAAGSGVATYGAANYRGGVAAAQFMLKY